MPNGSDPKKKAAELYKKERGQYPKWYTPPKATEVLREREATFELKGLRPRRRDLSPEDRVRMDAANVLTIFREGGMKDLSPTGLRTLRSSKPGLFPKEPKPSEVLREGKALRVSDYAKEKGISLREAERELNKTPTGRRAVRRESEIQRLSTEHGISVEQLSLYTSKELLDLEKKPDLDSFKQYNENLKEIREALSAEDDDSLADLRFIAEQQNNSIVLDKIEQLEGKLKEAESKRSEKKLTESLPDIQSRFSQIMNEDGAMEAFNWLYAMPSEFGAEGQDLLDNIMTDELMADIIVSTSKDVLNASTVDSEDDINLFIADIAEKLKMSKSELINRILDAIK